MSKTQTDITKNIMSRIEREHIVMKPKWYFIAGSVAMIAGLVGLSIVSIFLVNLIIFSLRTHGPMGEVRYQQLLSSFPWWSLPLIVVGLGFGIGILKKYDFSYKKNFPLVIVGFITAILISGFLMDYVGINTFLSRQKQMRGLYQQVQPDASSPKGQGRMQGK